MVFLIGYILYHGIPNLSLPGIFAWEYNGENQSMTPAIINTFIMVALTLLLAVPIGVGAAIYLVEYAKKGNKLVKVIRITAETLSGIPSIVYGLFGFIVFVITLGWSYTLIAGVITMAIMILPLIMRTTEEALMAVPDSFREGSFGLGAGKLRTVFRIVLPSAVPGILAGIILAIGRIVGESAALIFASGTNAVVAKSLFTSASTLSVHLYALLTRRTVYRTGLCGCGSSAVCRHRHQCTFKCSGKEADCEIMSATRKGIEKSHGSGTNNSQYGSFLWEFSGIKKHQPGHSRKRNHSIYRSFRLRQIHSAEVSQPNE